MGIIDWNTFQTLLGIVSGDSSTQHESISCSDSLKSLVAKRKELDRQKEEFRRAGEEAIIKEYERLRRVHAEFANVYREAHNTYILQKEDKKNLMQEKGQV